MGKGLCGVPAADVKFSVSRERVFGSASTDAMTRDSDMDLLVVESVQGDTREESVRIHDVLSGLGYPFDVIVISTKWFEESKSVIGGIAYPASKYGRIIYEAA